MILVKKFVNDARGIVDLGVVIMIGVVFAGLMVLAYIIFTLKDQLITTETSAKINSSLDNISSGFDDAINLMLVAITIFILAIAISALLMLRGR